MAGSRTDAILESSTGKSIGIVQRLRLFTPSVLFLVIYLSTAMFNYGYDVGVFSGIQAMTRFKERFGTCNAAGVCAVSSSMSSVMNSTPWIGKLIGCIAGGHIAARYGRKMTMLLIAVASLVGVVLQITATTIAQFTVGRIICYGMTGVCVLNIPSYMAETSPPHLRGLITTQMQIQITMSQLIASLINYGTKDMVHSDASWRIPIGVQFIAPVFLIAGWPFVTESPHWLVSKDRIQDAQASLKTLRNSNDEDAIHEAVQAIVLHRDSQIEGSWQEIFSGVNKRRTGIAILAMLGQQITGQAFTNQYGVIFYQQEGYTNSFQLNIISMAISVVTCLLTSSVIDGIGRRPLLIIGGFLQAVFLFTVGGLGTISHRSQTQKNSLVASLMLFSFAYALSWAPLSYVVLSEAASRRVVEKTNMLAISISVITAFVVSFTVPYLINADYAGLGARVGFIYGSFAVIMAVLAYFIIPEMKGRSLEQLDVLFEKGISARKFRNAVVLDGEVRFETKYPSEEKNPNV
ncbi:hypothetical protein P175DRAFT_0521539 [Aspergillus ochraceoroseus IBT 24754]|uniref:Major facilitator superfamily (MFS) profile domain-containing protein n=2 Tax=Aspergillus ochraceoroseus TaxID=138278 RepID=A0A2T5M1G4_9EURO|nr:uncharacterized protein P175DRAFT_0521539 [Aspergillus ochraceoroseus IBT 24754]KKK25375.1 hypothetical protein AOCH_004500 [Aspergillus ochraceoroseus]PTU22374.1 hypothetical protein P175DRAFT_0521539 [Aspergillus ochraceoroseus IBT 24754]